MSVFMDNNADGILDQRLKGEMELQEAQFLYKNVIENGLSTNKLKEINNKIVVE